MAIFELEIADSDVDRVFGAICANYGWSAQVPNPDFDPEVEASSETIDNPETQGSFTHRIVREFLAENVAAYEINEAKKSAAANVNTSVTLSDPNP